MATPLFNAEEQEEIKLAIQAAEHQTSGEIRVFVEAKCKEKNILDRAAYQFKQLKMHDTALRNGVKYVILVHTSMYCYILVCTCVIVVCI